MCLSLVLLSDDQGQPYICCRLASLIRAPQDKPYTDLVANFYDKEDVDGSRVDQSGPEIRFYFKDA